MQAFHRSDTSLWLSYEHKNSSLWKTIGFPATYKAVLCLASAQRSLHYGQQAASSSHRFGLCFISWLAPSGIFLLNNVDEHRLSATLALLGIFFKEGRRGAVMQWLSPLYCSLLVLPPFPSASLNSNRTWSAQDCAPHLRANWKKKADSQDVMDLLHLLVQQSTLLSQLFPGVQMQGGRNTHLFTSRS